MKRIVTILILTVFGYVSNAQQISDTIRIEKVILGYRYSIPNETFVGFSKLKTYVSDSKEAKKFIRKANSNTIFAAVLGGLGGAIAGFQLGGAASGGELNNRGLGLGLGLIALSVPFTIAADKNGLKGVKAYNASLLNK